MFDILAPAAAAPTHRATVGWTAVNATLRLKNASAVGPPAKHCDSMVPPYPACDLPLEVKLTSPLEVGGTVFLDGISLKPL